MTAVELLVVIGIIGVLMCLLLPAVMSAREAARRVQCKSNLAQLAKASHLHHDIQGYFPSDGWGFRWVGDPDRGFGQNQPGGWVFNILPYVEQQSLRNSSKSGGDPATPAGALRLLETPLPLLNCPTRRAADIYDYHGRFSLRNSEAPTKAAKSDYAINAGDHVLDAGPGPDSDGLRDLRRYKWPPFHEITGVSFVRSTIRMVDVRDGASYTILLGEKYIPNKKYAKSPGDDQTMYLGDDADIRRWTVGPPTPDTDGGKHKDRFGSRHAVGCHFALCDGSVRIISYDVDPEVFRLLGNRRDMRRVDVSQF